MELLPLFSLVLFFFRGHALSSGSSGCGLRSLNLLVSHLGGLTGQNFCADLRSVEQM